MNRITIKTNTMANLNSIQLIKRGKILQGMFEDYASKFGIEYAEKKILNLENDETELRIINALAAMK